jgi:hypothetical protein
VYHNAETYWQVVKLERSLALARAERLAGLGWHCELIPARVKRLAAVLRHRRPAGTREREEALPRPAMHGL